MDYRKLYAEMVDASERAIAAMEDANYGQARAILIDAEQRCEEQYLQAAE